jgi:flagellar biosynthesis/type III secretory pathway M-ring protein FliF/YscJ
MRRKKKKKAAALEQKASSEAKKAPATKGKSEAPAENTDVDDMLAKLVMKKSDESEVVEELMDKYPETVVQILRTWLTED